MTRIGTPRPRRTVVILLALTAALAACAPVAPAPTKYPVGTISRVIVYGDSLTAEAADAIRRDTVARLPGWDVVVRAFPGTAQCDWTEQMVADADLRPAVVLIAFFGNRLSPCAVESAWPDRYGSDAEWAWGFWQPRGADVVFIGAPPRVGERANPTAEVYRETAARVGAEFVTSNPSFVDPDGVARSRLSCQTGEQGCTDGAVEVRNPDQIHMCLIPLVAGPCVVPSPGINRWSAVLSDAAQRAAS